MAQVISAGLGGEEALVRYAGESAPHRQQERRQQPKDCGLAGQPIVNQLNMQLIIKKIHFEKPFLQPRRASGENAVLNPPSSIGMRTLSEAIPAFHFLSDFFFIYLFLFFFFLSLPLLLLCETHIPVYPCPCTQQQRSGHQTYRLNSSPDPSAGLWKRQPLKKQVRGRRLTPTGISCH